MLISVSFSYYGALAALQEVLSYLWALFAPDFASEARYKLPSLLGGGCWGCMQLVREAADVTF